MFWHQVDKNRELAQSSSVPEGIFDRSEHNNLKRTYTPEQITEVQDSIRCPVLRKVPGIVADILRRKYPDELNKFSVQKRC